VKFLFSLVKLGNDTGNVPETWQKNIT